MRLGILDCDRLDPDLADRFGPVYSEMFIRGFQPLAPELEFRVWSAIDGELPEDLHECDAWLITGSRHDAYSDIPWIQALRGWIRRAHDADVKLAGICFGHQVIAQALGGEVVKSTKGWGLGVSVHPMLEDAPGWRRRGIISAFWRAIRIRWRCCHPEQPGWRATIFVPTSCSCRGTT